ncbi:MAG TPA: hypothetical protein VLX90_13890 [Steroidobacteraceae bacterium]|nr:hypothetical protein [Steroidobacteraceae bacterium]
MNPSWYFRSLLLVRWLLGIHYVLNGLNWWYKILPFPNIHDPPDTPVKYAYVTALIGSGWMFQLSKIIELSTGIALLLNQFVPLMLVVSMSVAVTAFLMDFFIWHYIAGWVSGTVPFEVLWAKILDLVFFGGAGLAMQAYLIIGYLHVYRPMLARRAQFRLP